MNESFILSFPEDYRVGKYGRVIFRWNGYQMVIKKLQKNGKPCYIPTKLTDAITEQLQIPLFKDDENIEEPILIFGYTKNNLGIIENPRIVYFNGELKWDITTNDLPQLTAKPKDADVDVKIKRPAEIGKAQ